MRKILTDSVTSMVLAGGEKTRKRTRKKKCLGLLHKMSPDNTF